MSDIRVRLGKHIRQLRQTRAMTQEQLAEASDLSISFLGGIERGAKSPTIDTLEKIANAMEIPLHELMNFDTGRAVENEKTLMVHRLLEEYAEKIEDIFK